LLSDVKGAALELGIDTGEIPIQAIENTEHVHNVVVCTLCSCYPRMLIGLPPDWYKSRVYRSRVVREPRAVLKEFGTHIPQNVKIKVYDSTADLRYLIIPFQPPGTQNLDLEQLQKLVTRDSMIGVSLPKTPEETNF
jgi:nitrile hydratase